MKAAIQEYQSKLTPNYCQRFFDKIKKENSLKKYYK